MVPSHPTPPPPPPPPSEGPRGATTLPCHPATSARAENSFGGHLPGSQWVHPSVSHAHRAHMGQRLLNNREQSTSTNAGRQDSQSTKRNTVLQEVTWPATIADRPAGVPRRHPERVMQCPRGQSQVECSNGSHTEAVARTECPNGSMMSRTTQSTTDLPSSDSPSRGFSRTDCSNGSKTGASYMGLSCEDFCRTECSNGSRTDVPSKGPPSGVTPGTVQFISAHSSIKAGKVSSESNQRHGGPTPRPTTSKATFPQENGRELATGDWQDRHLRCI